jgi:hypothetical protein
MLHLCFYDRHRQSFELFVSSVLGDSTTEEAYFIGISQEEIAFHWKKLLQDSSKGKGDWISI